MDTIDRENAIDAEIVGPNLSASSASVPEPADIEGAPLPEAGSGQVVYRPARPLLFVSYVGQNAKGKQRFGRTFVSEFMTPVSVEEVRRIELSLEATLSLGDVQLLNWSQLRV